jgi:calcineurin-like phosphoesterase family protein
MARWTCSDYHLGEDRFELMGRPFRTIDEMIDTLIANHNNLVYPDDEVYMLGDVCYQKRPEYLCRVADFHGKKILVRGNHDRGISDKEFLQYFDKVIPEGSGIELDIEGIPCYLTHYPTRGRQDRFNLCGHVHGAYKYQLNLLNVCVDVHHFRPVNLKTIPFHFKAICEYYDQDVWIAYNPINEIYKGIRGKNSSYYSK